MSRLPLSDAISIDEVHLEVDKYCKYALVIQDFHTGEPIDILPSRRSNVTEPYFVNIPLKERLAVKYLISDMYDPYLRFQEKYFPNAVSVVDSFHVLKWLIHALDNYLKALTRGYQHRDDALYPPKLDPFGRPIRRKMSDEVYLLKKFKWLLLSNQRNIQYHAKPKLDKHFGYYMNTYMYEERFFALHHQIKPFRDLKEMYVSFNERNRGNPIAAATELDDLINMYQQSGQVIFQEFAKMLTRYREPIVNSFIMVERMGAEGEYMSRLSNGPIESMNRKIKDLKRQSRGYRNFDHIRNRFLFACRNEPPLDGRCK